MGDTGRRIYQSDGKAGWQHALTMPRLLHMRGRTSFTAASGGMKELRRDRRDYDFWELGKGVETGLVFEACLSMESCSDMCLTIRDDVTLSYQDGLLTLDMGNSGSGRTRRSVFTGTAYGPAHIFRHHFAEIFVK